MLWTVLPGCFTFWLMFLGSALWIWDSGLSWKFTIIMNIGWKCTYVGGGTKCPKCLFSKKSPVQSKKKKKSEWNIFWATYTYNPQTDGGTPTAVTGTRPKKVAWPSVNLFKALNAKLKFGALSIANTLMDFEVPPSVYVTVQQVPQPGEFQPVTAGAPPM